MQVQTKDAEIRPTGSDDDFPGTFEVVLSSPTRDRDGETLLPDEWKQPLPEHITFDQDHLMSVAGTVGSGRPEIDPATGNLIVSGTYSSLARAQDVRTLVREGHIRTTSVAFMTEKSPTKDGKETVTRELLNGAFVAVPSNREALVLAAKDFKAGARNSKSDAARVQSVHDHAVALGADCIPEADLAKSVTDTATKDFGTETVEASPAETTTDNGTSDPDDDNATALATAADDAANAAQSTAADDAADISARARALTLSAFTYAD